MKLKYIATGILSVAIVLGSAAPADAFILKSLGRWLGFSANNTPAQVAEVPSSQATQATSSTPQTTYTMASTGSVPKRWTGKTFTLYVPNSKTRNGKSLPIQSPYAVLSGVEMSSGGEIDEATGKDTTYGTHKPYTFVLANKGVSVHAIQQGTVESVSTQAYEEAPNDFYKGYGKYVIVKTDNFRILYANLDSVTVQVGATVSSGQQLGTVGDSGEGDVVGLQLIGRQDIQKGQRLEIKYVDLEAMVLSPDARVPDYDKNTKGIDLTPGVEPTHEEGNPSPNTPNEDGSMG